MLFPHWNNGMDAMGSFREQRRIRQIFHGAGAAGGAATPEGFQEARNKGKEEGEKLRTQFDAFRNASRGMEDILRPTAESVRAEAGALARVKRGILEFQRRGNKFISKEQLQLVTELNELIPDDDDKIVLAVLDGKLAVLGGSQIELNNLLDQLFQLEREHDRSMTTSAYKDDLQNAIAFYLSEVTPTSKNVFKVLENRAVTAEELDRFQAANPDFARNYPNEYLRIVTQAIRKNPTLIRRLEPGGRDSIFRSDAEFIVVLQRLIVTEENLGVIQALSDEWKRNHMQEYRSIVREAAKRNPWVLALIEREYRTFWMDTYEVPAGETGITYENIVTETLAEGGKDAAEKERLAIAVHSISEEWIEKNRFAYHRIYRGQAIQNPNAVIGRLTEESKSLLDNYLGHGTLGWAYAVLDVVREKPAALKELAPSMLWKMKTDVPQVYEQLKAAVDGKPELQTLLKDEDVVEGLLKHPDAFKEALRKNPDLLAEIDTNLLKDSRNAGAMKTLITENPVLLRYMPAWANNRDIAGNLLQKNAGIFAFIHPDLQKDPEIIAAAIRAEESGQGNFHWQSAPRDAYRTILHELGGGDPTAERFLRHLFDPEFKEETAPFDFYRSLPNNLRNNPVIMRSFLIRHRGDERLYRDTLDANKNAMAYFTPEATGMTWEVIMKLADEAKAIWGFDFEKLPADAVFALAKQLSDRREVRKGIWTKIPDETLAEVLIRISKSKNFLQGIEEIRNGSDARLEKLLGNPKALKRILGHSNVLFVLLLTQPSLIKLLPAEYEIGKTGSFGAK